MHSCAGKYTSKKICLHAHHCSYTSRARENALYINQSVLCNFLLVVCNRISLHASLPRETMSRNKFQSILRYIRFDDKNSRPICRTTDKFAAIQELWNSVMDNCQKSYFPHAGVTVHKQLFPYRWRLVFIYDKRFSLHCHQKAS